MTKKNQTRTSKQQGRTLIGTIIAGIILIIAVITAGITGVDLNDILDVLGQPTLDLPTRPPITVTAPPAPTTIPGTEVAIGPAEARPIAIEQGYGAERDFWQVFFTAPTGSRNPADYVGGIDLQIVAAINAAQRTLDIAAFEFNNPNITPAVINAHRRGVQVRVVTDTAHGMNADNTTITQLIEAGIPVREDGRSALMHNKFMIIDGRDVWTGSMNYTVNGAYRNNNNILRLRSNRAVLSYQAEFDEMFVDGQFGPRSPTGNNVRFVERGIPIEIIFAPEDDVRGAILERLEGARSSVRFMAFSFTKDSLSDVLERKAAEGVRVQGIYERVGSQTQFSTLTPLFCAGIDVRQDGNPFILHHKVFIVDDRIVLTGSFNFSLNATRSNDENMVIIEDPALAAQYNAEFDRRWAEATVPTALTCN